MPPYPQKSLVNAGAALRYPLATTTSYKLTNPAVSSNAVAAVGGLVQCGIVGLDLGSHPGVAENVLNLWPVRGAQGTALADQVFQLSRQLSSEGQLTLHNLLILLEGNVTTDHVEEEDTQ